MTTPTSSGGGVRRWALTAAAVAGAFLAGALAVGVISTAAAQTDTTDTTTTTQPDGYGAPDQGGKAGGSRDESQPQRSDEQLLTGEDADKARRPRWPSTRAPPSSASRPTPTASTRHTSSPPTATG